jgi:hypothetical protein
MFLNNWALVVQVIDLNERDQGIHQNREEQNTPFGGKPGSGCWCVVEHASND